MDDFLKLYPLNLGQALYVMGINRFSLQFVMKQELPSPLQRANRDFLQWCGFSHAAIRTALSRARKNGEVRSVADGNGQRRLEFHHSVESMTRFHTQPDRPGLTMAVFRFQQGEEKKRYTLKEVLKNFGFIMLTRNVYLTRRIETAEITQMAGEYGVEENLFLFHCGTEENREFLEKVSRTIDTEQWTRKLIEFRESKIGFWKRCSDDWRERYYRFLYEGAAFHTYVTLEIPPLPPEIFSGANIAGEILAGQWKRYGESGEEFLQSYLKLHRQED